MMMVKMKTIYLAIFFAVGIFTFNACSKDDDCLQQTWYQDSDGDSFGNPNNSIESCTQPTAYVLDNTDFDDANETAYVGAVEICDDNIDNNGDGNIDECGLLNKISGQWTDNFGTSWVINSSTITNILNNGASSVFEILVTDSNSVICLNNLNNSFDANLFSKFVFTNITNNTFNLCQPFFNETSQAAIQNSTDPTDPNDLEVGCGGFAWSEMTRN